ncbi:MAG: ACT domain-containing protein [Anaerotruncus massiliensis (ex Togo et al. 2019)]
MNGVSKITVTEDVALVTFRRVPNDLGVLASIFTQLADAKVNLDMISQTAPQGHRIDISFTLHSSQLIEVLGLATRFQAAHELKPMVSNGNCKIGSAEDAQRYGVASCDRRRRRDRRGLPSSAPARWRFPAGAQSSCDEAVARLKAFGVKAD